MKKSYPETDESGSFWASTLLNVESRLRESRGSCSYELQCVVKYSWRGTAFYLSTSDRRNALDYEAFRYMFRQAMRDSHLLSTPLLPSETLNLRSGDRSYRIFLHHNPGMNQPGLFHVATELKWTWDSILIARFATTEEDLLTELLGRENAPENTEPPFLRVDVTLHATVPMDGFYPVPSDGSWRKWAADVETTVRPYFLRKQLMIPNIRISFLGQENQRSNYTARPVASFTYGV